MGKKIYSWSKVQAGDIVSFRYKGTAGRSLLNSVLILNPKWPYKKVDGTNTIHLIGLKLEYSGNIPMIRSRPKLVQLLEKVGDIKIVSEQDDIYKVEIKNKTAKGATRVVYNRIKAMLKQNSVYRTYNHKKAKSSIVFLEPINLPKDVKEQLVKELLNEAKKDELEKMANED